jgi:hypothetical protein
VRELPTAKVLRQDLIYFPRTGKVFWRVAPPRWRKNTLEAGCYKTKYPKIVSKNWGAHSLHCVIWKMVTGKNPKHQIDHKNRDTHDNRWKNLRDATRSQNQANRIPRTAFKGVIVGIGRPYFHAQIQVRGKVRQLGKFKTAKEAHRAYVKAAKKHFGEFARAS